MYTFLNYIIFPDMSYFKGASELKFPMGMISQEEFDCNKDIIFYNKEFDCNKDIIFYNKKFDECGTFLFVDKHAELYTETDILFVDCFNRITKNQIYPIYKKDNPIDANSVIRHNEDGTLVTMAKYTKYTQPNGVTLDNKLDKNYKIDQFEFHVYDILYTNAEETKQKLATAQFRLIRKDSKEKPVYFRGFYNSLNSDVMNIYDAISIPVLSIRDIKEGEDNISFSINYNNINGATPHTLQKELEIEFK